MTWHTLPPMVDGWAGTTPRYVRYIYTQTHRLGN